MRRTEPTAPPRLTRAEQVAIVIPTVRREPDYVHGTLASLFASDPLVHHMTPVHLVVGEARTGTLGRHAHTSRLRVHRLAASQARRLAGWKIHRRLCFNAVRALRIGAACGESGVLYCEDDVVFADDFLARLLGAVHGIERRHRRYLLSASLPYPAPPPPQRGPGGLHAPYPGPFYGMQCLYLPRVVARAAAGFLQRHGVQCFEEPADLLLQRFAQQRGLRIFATSASLAQHVGERSTGVGSFFQSPCFLPEQAAEPPPPPLALHRAALSGDADTRPLRAEHARRLADHALALSGPFPRARFGGRGIVIGGGGRYFPCAWVCIGRLRALGCGLPIELWHLGPGELDESMAALLRPWQVTCVDATQVRARHPIRRLDGWALKPYALLHSRFAELLYLDADNVPLRDPGFLFEEPPYRRHGALFWPDYGAHAPRPEAWQLLGLQPRQEADFESGQMLVCKRRCWRPLQLALHLNAYAELYYRFMHGDKDTFHLAWRKLGRPYGMIGHRPGTLPPTAAPHRGRVMVQHDPAGRPLFQHRNLAKWTLDRPNPRIRGFRDEPACLALLAELARRWRGPLRPAGPAHRLGRRGGRYVRVPEARGHALHNV